MFGSISKIISRRVLLALCCGTFFIAASGAVNAAEDKFIVSGASGQLGELIVKDLLARGVAAKDLILVTRSPDKLAQYAKLGASVRMGDATKPETLPSAYAGGTRMVMVSIGGRYDTPRPELHNRSFQAAVKAGVKYIAFTSIIVAGSNDSSLGRDYRQSEDNAKASGAQWTMLRNGQYYEFSVLPAAIEMAKTGKAVVPVNEVKSSPITRADCAAAAASALLNPKFANMTLDVTGPELVGTEDIATAVSAITGKRIEITKQTAAEAAAAANGMGAVGGTLPSVPNKALQDILGHPATGLRAFLTAHKDELIAATK